MVQRRSLSENVAVVRLQGIWLVQLTQRGKLIVPTRRGNNLAVVSEGADPGPCLHALLQYAG